MPPERLRNALMMLRFLRAIDAAGGVPRRFLKCTPTWPVVVDLEWCGQLDLKLDGFIDGSAAIYRAELRRARR